MDEAEKYQQRLQAITEKRRLQEEQERAKREMEEERLRLQQLKRKSLRDQWLMDGPSSPTSSEPRSPLWGSQAQEMEQHIDKLQTESQRLTEEEEKLEQQMEDGRANAAVVVEATAEADQAVILENGQEEVEAESVLGTVEAALLERTEILTNGRGEGEGQAATHNASEEGGLHNGTNGPVTVVPEDGAITMTFLGFTEAEPGEAPVIEEGGLIMMRAERVIINDEGDELANDLSSMGQEQEVDSAASNQRSESPEEGGIEKAKPETTPEESSEVAKETETEADTVTGGLGEGQMDIVTGGLGEGQMDTVIGDLGEGQMDTVTGDLGEGQMDIVIGDLGEGQRDIVTRDLGEGQMDTVIGDLGEGQMDIVTRDLGEGQMDTVIGDLGGQMEGVGNSGGEEEAQPVEEAPLSDLQAPDGIVAAVPVYSETLLTPRPDAEGEAAGEPAEGDVEVKTEVEVEGEEEASVAPESAILPGGQFLEVSLVEPRTEPEQEPLLFPSKAQTLALGEQAPAAPETLTATRGEAEGGVDVAPKRKTCQCCSVM
uniref:paralemmin-3-like n=1 Tax=Oncorhynchus gorbuscha TaxID=8017 RepID=UPI001EAF6AB3|nr:paralemmin-3-like [Oncorhynchus gorbuscha]XP_046195713.1 paralemmin-3-like [Oncorhynchus gorbuscha]XP_046195714.1 paralemmin-3-like [Oncorhynchus gorbuscha]XP_046195715.1 paralemmin-3-like [Oncorhynchus gorbuscha]XP_046195717.1 paralemmin-3-like [Oncorhynchus gorbuscha]XP_046195718.1 paralemmin-3-like [Oncorhynchus gorbuscha]